ncbi:MAG: TonB-dependent receptor [Mediterranea sp.]|jgi:TonB-linked SusC/RagA family outer membrane protein|nr:TonB-dependent receptor [Mediterranea sp.]
MKKLIACCFLVSIAILTYAQNISLSGTVVGASDNEPLPGVNVVVKGNTTTGTITDADGRFSLSVPSNAVLSFSYVGYQPQDVSVNGRHQLQVVLHEDTEILNEVVVIGYGTQKKSVVTAAIARVSADDLSEIPPTRVDNVLKGLAAGVTATSASGQPGDGSRIRIRGVGTYNNADPLYIVDGMPIEGGIDYLNPTDIQSIEVLKDAASGAVYGTRAANGVILVTTKSGRQERTRVTYDVSYGWQNPWKHREVLNATEYAIMMNEGSVNSGGEIIYPDPYSYGEGTDWQKEVFNENAPVANHQLSISGGTEKVDYYLSLGFFTQEGIVGGNYGRSNYERLTLRSNTNYTLFDETKSRNFLNKLKIGVNASYARVKSTGITTNSEFGSPLGSALMLSPILGVYAEDEAATLAQYGTIATFTPVRDPQNGRLYMIAGPSYNEITNPLASLSLPASKGWSHKFVSNFYAELNIWDALSFRTSYGVDLSFWGNDSYTKKYYLTANNYADRSSVTSGQSRGTVWQLENTLSYDKVFGSHHVAVVLGQSAKKSSGRSLSGFARDMIEEDPSRVNLDFTTGLQANGDRNAWGGAHNVNTLASLFGRVSYDFDERYMLQVTVRRDGSSRFGSNNRYATFPSASVGWNLTNEAFMAERPDWWTTTKVRASWGKNGNDNIGDFAYVALTATNNNYDFGKGIETISIGTKPSILPNRNLTWEETTQTDIGLDFGFFNNAWTLSMDYYIKKTTGMLMTMPIPQYVGESRPTGNVGEMKNSGFELETNYRFRVQDWNFRIGGNASYVKNELINYGNDTGWASLDGVQGLGTISRAQNGLPFPYFYGYKTDGIFQNYNEINSYTGANGLIQPDAVPGDVRFVDTDNDGSITTADQTMIGKGMPDWTFGINLNVSWRNFDLSMLWQGTAGNDVYDATRRTDLASVNLPTYMLNRWTGDGSSNTLPRYEYADAINWVSSDLYVKDGSYLRLKNIQLGYTLPQTLTRKVFVSSLRFYVAAENLLTFTKYEGFDPEISSGGTSLGVDRGIYPQARTITIGANLSF